LRANRTLLLSPTGLSTCVVKPSPQGTTNTTKHVDWDCIDTRDHVYQNSGSQQGYITASMPKCLQTVTAASTHNKAELSWADRDKPSTTRDHIKDALC